MNYPSTLCVTTIFADNLQFVAFLWTHYYSGFEVSELGIPYFVMFLVHSTLWFGLDKTSSGISCEFIHRRGQKMFWFFENRVFLYKLLTFILNSMHHIIFQPSFFSYIMLGKLDNRLYVKIIAPPLHYGGPIIYIFLLFTIFAMDLDFCSQIPKARVQYFSLYLIGERLPSF